MDRRPGTAQSGATGAGEGRDNGVTLNRQVKLVLLGDQGVGKSSLALRFVRGVFHEHQEATIGAAFLMQTVNTRTHAVKMDIWDTAGQERYHSLAPMYYRGAAAAIVVFDVNSAQTFTRALAWVKELRQQSSGKLLIALAGNKADLASEHRAVSTEDAQAFAEENGLLFSEVSAKTGMGVSEIFTTLAEMLTQQVERDEEAARNALRLSEQQERKKSGCKC